MDGDSTSSLGTIVWVGRELGLRWGCNPRAFGLGRFDSFSTHHFGRELRGVELRPDCTPGALSVKVRILCSPTRRVTPHQSGPRLLSGWRVTPSGAVPALSFIATLEGDVAMERPPAGTRVAAQVVRVGSAAFLSSEGTGQCWPTGLEPQGALTRRSSILLPSSTFLLDSLHDLCILPATQRVQCLPEPSSPRQPSRSRKRCGGNASWWRSPMVATIPGRRPRRSKTHKLLIESPGLRKEAGASSFQGAKLKWKSAALRTRRMQVRALSPLLSL